MPGVRAIGVGWGYHPAGRTDRGGRARRGACSRRPAAASGDADDRSRHPAQSRNRYFIIDGRAAGGIAGAVFGIVLIARVRADAAQAARRRDRAVVDLHVVDDPRRAGASLGDPERPAQPAAPPRLPNEAVLEGRDGRRRARRAARRQAGAHARAVAAGAADRRAGRSGGRRMARGRGRDRPARDAADRAGQRRDRACRRRPALFAANLARLCRKRLALLPRRRAARSGRAAGGDMGSAARLGARALRRAFRRSRPA